MKKWESMENKIFIAYSQLLSEIFDRKIKVTDIIEICGISRRTFYNYFSSTNDLHLQIIIFMQDEINLILNDNTIFENGTSKKVLNYLFSNKDLFFNLINYYPDIDKISNAFIKSTFQNYSEESFYVNLNSSMVIPTDYLFDVYVSIIQTIVFRWIKNYCTESSEEILLIINNATAHIKIGEALN